MGFAGRNSETRYTEQLEKTLRKGGTKHKKTNTEIEFVGQAERFTTFEGLCWTATGRMEFRHWGTRVMAVDFDRDMITDFGYTGYSMTTDKNLRGWSRALRNAEFQGMQSLNTETQPFRWTDTHKRGPRGAGYAEAMFERFCAGVPWIKRIDGVAWFDGAKFSPALEDHYDVLRREILSDGVSWHWFTADWNKRKQWAKRFIDDAAKARWDKREAKRMRAEAMIETSL